MHIVVFRKSNPNCLWGRFGSQFAARSFVESVRCVEPRDLAAFDTERWQIVYPEDEDCVFPVTVEAATANPSAVAA